MNIIEYFDINLKTKELISIVGGGGKTTTMFKLANELKALNKRVLVTTTTAIYNPDADQYDKLIILGKDNAYGRYLNNTITVMGREVSAQNKLLGAFPEYIDYIYKEELFDYIIVEADGSKGRPIKAPASHEPVIPSCTTKTIGVVGMDCLGKRIDDEYVHRSELFAQITDSSIGEYIREETILKLIVSKNGIFKGVPYSSKKYLLFNKADYQKDREAAIKIKNLVVESEYDVNGIIVGSMNSGNIIRF
ncbi:selenium cofactor biosynthesis protein YqeC [Brassicibacter mesophilus]|uniref:selenium cofactor biosynthesis protein YqeC n=1 Tax=Brassicibacter mesophilus TaxID=745119 RepID=UPI003D203EEA